MNDSQLTIQREEQLWCMNMILTPPDISLDGEQAVMNTGGKSQDLELLAQMSSSFSPQSLGSFPLQVYENSPSAAQETFLLTT